MIADEERERGKKGARGAKREKEWKLIKTGRGKKESNQGKRRKPNGKRGGGRVVEYMKEKVAKGNFNG